MSISIKKKIGFFSSILVGFSIVSIPSLFLCLGVSKMNADQIKIPQNCIVSVYGKSNPSLIFGGIENDYVFLNGFFTAEQTFSYTINGIVPTFNVNSVITNLSAINSAPSAGIYFDSTTNNIIRPPIISRNNVLSLKFESVSFASDQSKTQFEITSPSGIAFSNNVNTKWKPALTLDKEKTPFDINLLYSPTSQTSFCFSTQKTADSTLSASKKIPSSYFSIYLDIYFTQSQDHAINF
jgi:hypothetical protein